MAKELPEGMAVVAPSPGVINTDMLASCFGISAAFYQTPEAWYEHLFTIMHFALMCCLGFSIISKWKPVSIC